MDGDSDEAVSSMEIVGPDGRVTFRGAYLTDSGKHEEYPPGEGPWPTQPGIPAVDEFGDPVEDEDEEEDDPGVIATGELWNPPPQS